MYSCLTFIKVCGEGGGDIMTRGDREMAGSFPTNAFKGGSLEVPSLRWPLCERNGSGTSPESTEYELGSMTMHYHYLDI